MAVIKNKNVIAFGGNDITESLQSIVSNAGFKLYRHNMMLRFNDGNRKIKIDIVNNRSTEYTVNDLTTYMRANHTATNANITGNLAGIIPGATGYYKDSSNA